MTVIDFNSVDPSSVSVTVNGQTATPCRTDCKRGSNLVFDSSLVLIEKGNLISITSLNSNYKIGREGHIVLMNADTFVNAIFWDPYQMPDVSCTQPVPTSTKTLCSVSGKVPFSFLISPKVSYWTPKSGSLPGYWTDGND